MDWNQAWGLEIDLWQKASGKSCQEFWADKKSARIFAQKEIEHQKNRIDQTLASLDLKKSMQVLDIGSGPGSLAIPMARKVNSVTTVEPSSGMNQVMADLVAEENLTNIIPVAYSWEEVPIARLTPPYDLVVASLSLGMRDIRAAIEKMNQVCSGQVALFWHGGIPEWEDMPRALWPDLFNTPYHGGPKGDILFQVLYQMGIYPEIKVFSNYFCEIFSSLDEAVTFYGKRFQELGPQHGPVLRAYLEDHCKKTKEGLVHGFNHVIMKFSWSPRSIQGENPTGSSR